MSDLNQINDIESDESFNTYSQPRIHISRKLSFMNFLRIHLYPEFRFSSFIFLILMTNITIYFTMILHSGVNNSNRKDFLAVKQDILISFGATELTLIKTGQVWRLLTSIILNFNFQQLALNCLLLILVGSNIEASLGIIKTSFLFIFGGFFGSLFGLILSENNNISVNSSISIYCLIGGYFSMMFINWIYDGKFSIGLQNYVWIILPIFSYIYYMNLNGKNSFGHLGGFIIGFFLFPIIVKPIENLSLRYLNALKMIASLFLFSIVAFEIIFIFI